MAGAIKAELRVPLKASVFRGIILSSFKGMQVFPWVSNLFSFRSKEMAGTNKTGVAMINLSLVGDSNANHLEPYAVKSSGLYLIHLC